MKQVWKLVLLFAVSVIAFLWVLFHSGCTSSRLNEIQTAQHDLAVQIKDAQDLNKSAVEFKEDCYLEEIRMSKDSFAYVTKCPKTATHLKKEVMNKTKPLMK